MQMVSSKEIVYHNPRSFLALYLLLLLVSLVMFILRRRIKDIEVTFILCANLQYARHISTPITIIGRTPYRAQQVVEQHLITLITKLMRAQNMALRVKMQKLPHHCSTERVPCSSRTETELVFFGVWIAPHQIRHRSFVRDLPEAVDDFDLVNTVDGWRQAAMHAENLVIDNDAEG